MARAPKTKPAKKRAKATTEPKRGRKGAYTDALGRRICEYLADGETLISVCRRDDIQVSERTVRTWAADPDHPFSPNYARAREIGYHRLADQIIEIADNVTITDTLDPATVQRDRLRVEARKWLLSKALPKIYGDKVELTGKDGGPIETRQTLDLSKLTDDELAAYQLLAAASARNRAGDKPAAVH